MKLLESLNDELNNSVQYPKSGAAINFQACQKTSGALFGCGISNTTYQIKIAAGILVVRGYRFEISAEETLIDFTGQSLPSTPATRYLYLRIVASGNNASFSIQVSQFATTGFNASIEQVDGTYDYKLATFILSTSGISNLTSNVSTITASSGGSGTVALTVPVPLIEVVTGVPGNTYDNGYLCLRNKSEYASLVLGYTVKLALYRYVQKGRYSLIGGSGRMRFYKSGYVKPIDSAYGGIGWRRAQQYVTNPYYRAYPYVDFRLSFAFSGLTSATIATKDTASYVRNDIIEPLSNYIDGMFYEMPSQYNESANCMLPLDNSRQPVTETSNPFFIRCTRSKNAIKMDGNLGYWLGAIKGTQMHNFFRFCYVAEVYNSNGDLVAQSPKSRDVIIRPAIRKKFPIGDQSETTWAVNIGGLFEVKIV